jgi:signal transduction histidine kinase
MIITQYEFETTMTDAGEQSVRNIIRLTLLDIENEYMDLMFYKERALESRKLFLKDITDIALNNIEHHYKISEKKIISKAEAKKLVLEETKNFRYGNNYYFFIYNKDLVAISHPDPEFMGKDMSNFRVAGFIRTVGKFGMMYNRWKSSAILNICLHGNGWSDQGCI